METKIQIPDELAEKIRLEAEARGVTISQYIQQILESKLASLAIEVPVEPDPLFADSAVYEGEVPKDLSGKHDDYLYGDAS